MAAAAAPLRQLGNGADKKVNRYTYNLSREASQIGRLEEVQVSSRGPHAALACTPIYKYRRRRQQQLYLHGTSVWCGARLLFSSSGEIEFFMYSVLGSSNVSFNSMSESLSLCIIYNRVFFFFFTSTCTFFYNASADLFCDFLWFDLWGKVSQMTTCISCSRAAEAGFAKQAVLHVFHDSDAVLSPQPIYC